MLPVTCTLVVGMPIIFMTGLEKSTLSHKKSHFIAQDYSYTQELSMRCLY